MKTLNINIVYQVRENVKSGDKYQYKIHLSFNKDNESVFVWSEYLFLTGYSQMIGLALDSVLAYMGKKAIVFSTINYNVINFDF